MKKANGKPAPTRIVLTYQLIRNTTSPDEVITGVKSFVANFPATEILRLNTKENLRSYIAEWNTKKRNRVHEAIRDTIESSPARFITRNSGFVIAASDIDVDDAKRKVTLTDPSILNGAQSQGEVRQYLIDTYGSDFDEQDFEPPFYVRAEIIVDSDPDEVVETAIARNTATPVKSISQAGARGHLDELEAVIAKHVDGAAIKKRETDDDDHLDTRKILQYARLLMPESVSKNASAAEKLRAYKNPEQCLTDFCAWSEGKKVPENRRKYEFTVQIAPFALKEYEYWESHDGWNGHHIWEETKKGGRACRRDDNGRIVWASPGLVFPILSAMSEFVEEYAPGKWKLTKPKRFQAKDMIRRAVDQFRAHGGDPMLMGRSAGVYDALRIYPQTLMEVMRDLGNQ